MVSVGMLLLASCRKCAGRAAGYGDVLVFLGMLLLDVCEGSSAGRGLSVIQPLCDHVQGAIPCHRELPL